MTLWILYIATGVLAGTFSGFFGLGGGIIVVPLLVLLFGFSQHAAQGTSTAMMIPPIGLFAAWVYLKNGHVNLPAAIALCIGFTFGALWGARLAELVAEPVLRKIFGLFLLATSLRLLCLR